VANMQHAPAQCILPRPRELRRQCLIQWQPRSAVGAPPRPQEAHKPFLQQQPSLAIELLCRSLPNSCF
jgi:hypothetical protein